MQTKSIGSLFGNPRRTAFCLVALALTSIAFQAFFDWHPDFLASQLVFACFATLSIFAGYLIIFWVPRSLLRANQLLLRPSESQSVQIEFPTSNPVAVALLTLGLAIGAIAVYTHSQVGLPWSGLVLWLYLGSVFLIFFALASLEVCTPLRFG
jgi:hypothetical protein